MTVHVQVPSLADSPSSRVIKIQINLKVDSSVSGKSQCVGVVMAKILIVATQFPGLTSHGGTSRPTYMLAKRLAGLQHSITVAVGRTEFRLTNKISSNFSNEGIRLIEVKNSGVGVSPWWLEFQFNVANLIHESGPYDLIISQEWQSPLALCVRSHFLSTPIITWCHGGSIYDNLGNNFAEQNPVKILENSLEQKQIEFSSRVVFPSQYLCSLYADLGIVSQRSNIIPLFFPENLLANIDQGKSPCIAFVGGLTKRKGFDLFIEHARSLLEIHPNLEVRVYGKELDFSRKDLQRLKASKITRIEFFENKQTEEIWAELSSRNTTLICPSRIDNSPGVIYEALASGSKVLVSDSQGGFELSKYAETTLKRLSELQLDEMLEFILSEPLNKIDIALINKQTAESWEALIADIAKERSEPDSRVGFKVSVIIATKDRIDFLRHAISSLCVQHDYVGELIVVDDGSRDIYEVSSLLNEMQLPFKTRLVKNAASVGPGLSRNRGVQESTFEYVCFLDDDNLFFPNHLEIVTSLAREKSLDAVTTYLAQAFSNKPLDFSNKLVHAQVAVFCGDLFGNLNVAINLASDTHLLIKRSVFDSVGGFNNLPGTSQEDWGLALKIIGSGAKFESTFRPTVLYRLNSDGVQAQGHGLKHNLPVNEGAQKLFLDGGTIAELARIALSPPSYNGHPRLSKSFRYGLRLLKAGQFRILFRGVLNKSNSKMVHLVNGFKQAIFRGPMIFRYVYVAIGMVVKGNFSNAIKSFLRVIGRNFSKE